MLCLTIAATLSALALGQDVTAENGNLDANLAIEPDSKLLGSDTHPGVALSHRCRHFPMRWR